MPKIVAEQTDNDLFQVLDSANPRGFEDAQPYLRRDRVEGGPARLGFRAVRTENLPLLVVDEGQDS